MSLYGGAAGPIEVVVEASADEVTVRVIDSGEPPESAREPFGLSAGRQATAAGRAGAGIGLYVADRLVKAMRGRMWARASAAKGAEFGFTLARFGGVRPSDGPLGTPATEAAARG
jgi:signal transduction histidine kinase